MENRVQLSSIWPEGVRPENPSLEASPEGVNFEFGPSCEMKHLRTTRRCHEQSMSTTRPWKWLQDFNQLSIQADCKEYVYRTLKA